MHLLRHGETEGAGRYHGSTDIALSARGWQQMRQTTADLQWDLVISSPLQRCAAFAAELAQQRQLPYTIEGDLREVHFGAWEGRSATELMQTEPQLLRRFWEDPLTHTPPGGESLQDLQQRVLQAWRRIVARHAGTRVLIVTHGGPIRVLLAARAGMALSQLLSIDVPHAALESLDTRS